MGKSLRVALIAFVAGGLSALVAASAENAGAVDRIRSAATAGHTHRESPPRSAAAPVTGLNTLPLLPPPSPRGVGAETALPAVPAPGGAKTLPVLDASAAKVTALPHNSAPSASASSKAIQRAKKSASWTRRSEIIDPWSARR